MKLYSAMTYINVSCQTLDLTTILTINCIWVDIGPEITGTKLRNQLSPENDHFENKVLATNDCQTFYFMLSLMEMDVRQSVAIVIWHSIYYVLLGIYVIGFPDIAI